jgi:hypothetical protein
MAAVMADLSASANAHSIRAAKSSDGRAGRSFFSSFSISEKSFIAFENFSSAR